jgi:F0F1-type ATP synthase assembly protein I
MAIRVFDWSNFCDRQATVAAMAATADKRYGAQAMQPNPLFVFGIVVGLAIGVLFGLSIGNVAFGIPSGTMLGLVIGFLMSKAGNDQT